MKDGEKTKEQLINELGEMRHRIAELEAVDSERQCAEERVEHLNAVLRAIRGVNQLIVRERDRDGLLQGVCDKLIETRGYYNTWIALLDESGGLVTTAEAGLGEAFSPMVEQLKRGELTACGQRALARRGIVVTDDPLSACADCPLSAKYAGRGAMTVRLEHDGKAYGLLSVSIPAHLTADEEERFLFEEVAGDIALALQSIELEEKRVRAEEALRKQSRDAYKATFESTGTAMLIGEADSTISMINTEFEKLCGYSKEEVEGKKSWVEFIVEADLERLEESHRLRMIDPNAAPPFYEFQFIDKQGNVKHIFITLARIPGTKKTVGSLLDITEHKRAEEALRDSRRMLQTVLDSIPSTLFWKDRDSIYLGANRALLETAGLQSSEEVVGKSDYDLPWGKKQADSFREDDRKVMESGIPEYDIIEPHLRADGTRAWAMTNKVPLRDTKGNVVGVLGTSEDITERKRAEEELREKRGEVPIATR